MKIELYEANGDEALRGAGPELWLRALSNEVVDLPRAEAALDEAARVTRAGYAKTPCAFYPALGDDDHGFAHESWWIFKKTGA